MLKRPLDCFLYYLLGENIPTKHTIIPIFNCAKNWGFKVPNEIERFNDISGVVSFVKKWGNKKRHLRFEIDGIVIKVDDVNIQEIMGLMQNFPDGAISYKFKAEQVSTILKNHISDRYNMEPLPQLHFRTSSIVREQL